MAETKRLRVSKACDSCRRKKVKCDALHPLCTNCETFGYDCTYNDPTKKRGPPKGYIEAIEARLHRMEGLLGGLVKDKDPRAEIVRAELDAMAREAEMTGLKLRRSRAYEEINHKIGSGSSNSANSTPTSLSSSLATGLLISSPGQGKKTKHPIPIQNSSYPGTSSHQIQPNPVASGPGPGPMNPHSRTPDMTMPPRHPGGLQPSPIPASHVDPVHAYDSVYGAPAAANRGQPSPYYPPTQQFQSVHHQHASPTHSPKGSSHLGTLHTVNGLGLQDMPPSVEVHGPSSGHPRQHHYQAYPSYPSHHSNNNHHHYDSANSEKQTLDELRMQFMTKTLPQQGRRPPPLPALQRSHAQESASSLPATATSHPITGYLPVENSDIGQQLVMPAPDVMDHLLEVHFGHVHPVLPMLHYKTISEQIHLKKSTPHLVFAMLGLASRFSNNAVFRTPQPGVPRPPCTIFYERAKFFIKNEYDNSQMSTIQALLLMAVQQMGFCESQRAWLYVGMAIRMAQDLGLNKEPSDQEKERDPLLAELRKRTWWSCYVVERLVCAGLGRPLTITARECQTRLPYMEDEVTPPKVPGGPPQDVAVIGHFAHLVTLSRLQGNILEFIQARAAERQSAKDSSTDQSPVIGGTSSGGNTNMGRAGGHLHQGADLNSFTHSPSLARELDKGQYQVDTSPAAFSALDKALMEWRQHLPENLRDPTPSSPHFGLFLHLTYNTVLILLHRPEIPFSPTSASLCTQAAMTITDIIEILSKARALSSMFISILYAIFSAGIIHFMNIPGTKRPSRAPSPALTSASSVHSTPRLGTTLGLGLSTGTGAGAGAGTGTSIPSSGGMSDRVRNGISGGVSGSGNSSTGTGSMGSNSGGGGGGGGLSLPNVADQQASLSAKTNLKRCIDALRFLASHWLSAARRAKVLEDLLDLKHVSLRDLEEDTFQTVNLDPDWTSNTGYGLALRGPRERHDKLRQRCRSKVMAIQSLLANDDDHVAHPAAAAAAAPPPSSSSSLSTSSLYAKDSQQQQQQARQGSSFSSRRSMSSDQMLSSSEQDTEMMGVASSSSSSSLSEASAPQPLQTLRGDQDITMEQAPSGNSSLLSMTSTSGESHVNGVASGGGFGMDQPMKETDSLFGVGAASAKTGVNGYHSQQQQQQQYPITTGMILTTTTTPVVNSGFELDPMMMLGSNTLSFTGAASTASNSTHNPQGSSMAGTEMAMAAGLGLSTTSSSSSPSTANIATTSMSMTPLTSGLLNGGGVGGPGGGAAVANMFDPFSMPSSITFPLGGGGSGSGHSASTSHMGTPMMHNAGTTTASTLLDHPESMMVGMTRSGLSMSFLPTAAGTPPSAPEMGQENGQGAAGGMDDKMVTSTTIANSATAPASAATVVTTATTGAAAVKGQSTGANGGGVSGTKSVGSPTWEYHGQMGKPATTRTGLSVYEQELHDLEWNDMPVTLGLDEWMAYIGALMMRWLASGESSPKTTPSSL